MATIVTLCSCSTDEMNDNDTSCAKETPLTVVAVQPSVTRATATDFEEGDRIGLYVADEVKELELSGNLVNNEPLTLASDSWSGRHPLFWDEGRYNAYAY